MQYKVVSTSSMEITNAQRELEDQVSQLIKDGWKPLGGVSLSVTPVAYAIHNFAQAMIKEDE